MTGRQDSISFSISRLRLDQLELGPQLRNLMPVHLRRSISPRVAHIGRNVGHLLVIELPREARHRLETWPRWGRCRPRPGKDHSDDAGGIVLLRNRTARLGSGKRLIDWVYLDDVVDAFVRVGASAPLDTTIDIGSGRLLSVHDCALLIGQLMDRSHLLEFDPARAQLVSEVTERRATIPVFRRPDGSYSNW